MPCPPPNAVRSRFCPLSKSVLFCFGRSGGGVELQWVE